MARILLADDDHASREFVRRALEGDGHSVTSVTDGKEALDLLADDPGRFDLLVTDVQMPVLDGISLAEQALETVPKLRIVLMSGFAEQLDRAKGFKATKLGAISKPFSLEQIKALVRNTLT
jgi:CheY-like chemotaxis protein